MSDALDRAQEAEQFRRDLAIRAFRAGLGDLARPSAFLLCDGCGDPLDAERRKALPGATRCVECQQAAERASRLVCR